jgi:hypothetical protein
MQEEHRILHVVFSMDCLPAGARGDVRGPARWDQAGRSMVAFARALVDRGLGGTFFVAPEALNRLGAAAGEVRSAGCELGVLCHPQLSGYPACLGAYGCERQREILKNARHVWEAALTEAPSTFRPGFFSANDYTFYALCMEGFRQGSCSLPGRMDDEQCSMWYGSYPFPHHTDPLDRTLQGTMEFFEVPVTSDFDAASCVSCETYTPPHLRIEEPDVHAYARNVIARQLDRMDEEEVAFPTVSFVTSNVVGWGTKDDPHVERLGNLCDMLREVAGERRMDLRWEPLAGLHQMTDEELGMPWTLAAGEECA